MATTITTRRTQSPRTTQGGKRQAQWLRGIPSYITTCSEVASLVSAVLGDTLESDVRVASPATTVEWRSHAQRLPRASSAQCLLVPFYTRYTIDDEWDVSALASLEHLTLDCHFLGPTPLNDVDRDLHIADCIAVSGLASYPFGSGQPRGSDKGFMWIRDEAPACIPGMRTIINGYDSSLVHSTSAQSIRPTQSSLSSS